ncbi:MAG: hypothetical protein M1540_03390 [Candidatus Bathyarchaeota archaeon]|nr:hypothetical protein [Candidatus Bathyarchaeota archaeon]
MASYIQAFDSIDKVLSIKEWNELASKSENPYYLSGFIEQFFNSAIKLKQKPLCLVYFSEQKAVGIAPVAISHWRGVFRIASFLTGSDFDPDFVVEEKYREQFIHETIDFLFRKMGCTFIDFSMPSKTRSLQILRENRKTLRGSNHILRNIAGHSVIFVEETWADFEKRRGRNFKKFFRNIERRMTLSGNWRIEFASSIYSQAEIKEYFLEIEKESWKQSYRAERGIERDEGLLELFTAAANTQLIEAGFKWEVAFLEIDGKKSPTASIMSTKAMCFSAKHPSMTTTKSVIQECTSTTR